MSKKLKDENAQDDQNPSPETESASSGPEVKSVMEWAALKGHIASAKPVQMRGQIHKGRDVQVIRFHNKLTANQPMTEAEYDAASDAAYGLVVR